jgi:hypothetical protein
MDKRQKKDIRHIRGTRRQKKDKTMREIRKEKETRLEDSKNGFYIQNKFAHSNEYIIFPSRMMLMMLLIEQKLDFEVHLMLFHLDFHYPMIPLLLMME